MIWCGSAQHVPPTSPFLGRPPPLLCWLCVKRVGHGGARCNLIWTVPFPAWHNVFLWIGLRFPYIINFDECVIWLYHFQKSLQASLPFQLDFFFWLFSSSFLVGERGVVGESCCFVLFLPSFICLTRPLENKSDAQQKIIWVQIFFMQLHVCVLSFYKALNNKMNELKKVRCGRPQYP